MGRPHDDGLAATRSEGGFAGPTGMSGNHKPTQGVGATSGLKTSPSAKTKKPETRLSWYDRSGNAARGAARPTAEISQTIHFQVNTSRRSWPVSLPHAPLIERTRHDPD